MKRMITLLAAGLMPAIMGHAAAEPLKVFILAGDTTFTGASPLTTGLTAYTASSFWMAEPW